MGMFRGPSSLLKMPFQVCNCHMGVGGSSFMYEIAAIIIIWIDAAATELACCRSFYHNACVLVKSWCPMTLL